MKKISVTEFSKIIEQDGIILVDVRSPDEFELVNIGGINIPVNQIMDRVDDFKKDDTIYFLCHHGSRSEFACLMFSSRGFANVINIEGGIHAYAIQVGPDLRTY